MTALSATEQATLDRIEAAPDAPEAVRMRVAVAMWMTHRPPDEPVIPWIAAADWQQRNYLRMADAAITVVRGVA